MNFFEAEIAKYERRLHRIGEKPDPTKAESNRLLYELELDLARSHLESWKQGRPFAAGFYLSPMLRAMGFEFIYLMHAADRAVNAEDCFRALRAVGFPDDACDRTMVALAMCLREELPRMSLIVSTNAACYPEMLSHYTLASYHDAPRFCLDIASTASKQADYDHLTYVTDQLRQLIDFAVDRIPGIEYDEGKMVELQNIDRAAVDCLRDIYELRKLVPCPEAGRDVFRIPRLPSFYAEPVRALDYFRTRRDEVRERAARGVSPSGQEKLRILWAVSGPYYSDPFGFLEQRGVSVPFFLFGIATRLFGVRYGMYGDETEYGRKLTPLEEQARVLNCNAWAGLATRWVEDALFVCRDLKIDAIVNFLQRGCGATLGLAKLLADEAEEKLGIPTLQIEGRQLDSGDYDERQFLARLSDFVDMCLPAAQ